MFPQNEAGFLPDPSLRLILQAVGFRSTIALEELSSIDLPEGRIISIPFFGEHGDLNIRSKAAYAVSLKGKQLLLAADSNTLEESSYDHARTELGPVDTTFVGMECEGAPLCWVYGHVPP